jgi:hypothetical protein
VLVNNPENCSAGSGLHNNALEFPSVGVLSFMYEQREQTDAKTEA